MTGKTEPKGKLWNCFRWALKLDGQPENEVNEGTEFPSGKKRDFFLLKLKNGNFFKQVFIFFQ